MDDSHGATCPKGAAPGDVPDRWQGQGPGQELPGNDMGTETWAGFEQVSRWGELSTLEQAPSRGEKRREDSLEFSRGLGEP